MPFPQEGPTAILDLYQILIRLLVIELTITIMEYLDAQKSGYLLQPLCLLVLRPAVNQGMTYSVRGKEELQALKVRVKTTTPKTNMSTRVSFSMERQKCRFAIYFISLQIPGIFDSESAIAHRKIFGVIIKENGASV
jgi:hypothetical protein